MAKIRYLIDGLGAVAGGTVRVRAQVRDRIPFVVVVQSSLYDDYRRRVVVGKSSLGQVPSSRFNPTFRIKGMSVVLHPLEIVSVAKESLGDKVGSLADEGDQIIEALDELLTRWR